MAFGEGHIGLSGWNGLLEDLCNKTSINMAKTELYDVLSNMVRAGKRKMDDASRKIKEMEDRYMRPFFSGVYDFYYLGSSMLWSIPTLLYDGAKAAAVKLVTGKDIRIRGFRETADYLNLINRTLKESNQRNPYLAGIITAAAIPMLGLVGIANPPEYFRHISDYVTKAVFGTMVGLYPAAKASQYRAESEEKMR